MKITNIQTYLYFYGWRNLIIVKVETDEGITGVGEATVRNKELAVKETIQNHIAPLLIGTSPFEIEAFFNKFFTRDPWRNGVVFNSAVSGIEIALWDIVGKRLGVPVYNLMGGKMRDRIRLYANDWFTGCKTKEAYTEAAVRTAGEGFTALKWDPAKVAPEGSSERQIVRHSIECIEAVRAGVGMGVDLLIEIHGKLSYDGALELTRNIEAVKPMFIEEPMHPDDKEGFRKLKAVANIPIASGERIFTRWGYKQIFKEADLSIIQPDITHMGGIYETKKTASMAEASYLKVAPHNSNGPVATMANAVLDASLPNFLIQEFSYGNIELNSKLLREPFLIKDGHIILEDKPGLGISVDFEAIEKNGYKSYFTT